MIFFVMRTFQNLLVMILGQTLRNLITSSNAERCTEGIGIVHITQAPVSPLSQALFGLCLSPQMHFSEN